MERRYHKMSGRYGYQIEGKERFKSKKRNICGDQVGLGKSCQAIDAVMELGCARTLVITLNSLKNNFEAEIRKWYPEATTTIVRSQSTVDQRDEQINIPSQFTIVSYNQIITITKWEKKTRPDGTVYKTPLQVLPQNVPTLLKQPWDCIIIDEAHYLRGRGSKALETAKKLSRRSKYLFLLTGTSFYSSQLNIFPLLQLIDSEKFSSFHRWASEHFNKKKNYFSGYDDYTTVKDTNRFKASIEPYIFTRLTEDVRKDLPDKSFIYVPYELEPAQRKQYDTMRKRMALEFAGKKVIAQNELSKIIRLRQICMSPSLLLKDIDLDDPNIATEGKSFKGVKIDVILDLLESFGDVKFLIFACHATPVWRFLPLLQQRMNVKAITGKVPPGTNADTCNTPTRCGILKSFKEGDTQGLIMTIGAGGTGLNLPEASRMIFMDTSTIPAENEQAVGRMMRTGQVNKCLIYLPYAINTIEEKILNISADRDAIFKASTPVSEVSQAMLEYIVKGN